jgi:C4-dicarboxylate transporter, DctM subunit
MIEASLGFLAVFAMAFLRIPLALAMAMAGIAGLGLMRGWQPAFASTSQVIFETGFAYVLSVIPLFILMGNLVARAGMARELYTAANAFVGHRKGGLAMASIIASGGFGSICGSSIATAATMTRVAYPEMKRHGYKDTLATGAIASGGTLGILIPPSTVLVIYGIITETDIGKLFIAGILPGLVAMICLCLAVVYITWRDPAAGPPAERFNWAQRLAAVVNTPPCAASGAWACCSRWSSAASTAACSPPPRALAWVRRARSSSPCSAARSPRACCSTSWWRAPEPRPCCSPS